MTSWEYAFDLYVRSLLKPNLYEPILSPFHTPALNLTSLFPATHAYVCRYVGKYVEGSR